MMTPIVHFGLGPLSIVASVYYTLKSFKGSKIVVSGSATCPRCKKISNIMTGKYKFPIYDTCTRCMREVKLSQRKGGEDL